MHYFAGLTPDELQEIRKYIAFEKRVEKGQTLLFESEQSEYMYLIISGAVKVYKNQLIGKNRY